MSGVNHNGGENIGKAWGSEKLETHFEWIRMNGRPDIGTFIYSSSTIWCAMLLPGENPGQFDLPPSSPLAALILSTAASSVSSGHTLSVRGRQLVATATSIAVKDLGLALTLTG